jgi:hypothetical protein
MTSSFIFSFATLLLCAASDEELAAVRWCMHALTTIGALASWRASPLGTASAKV